MFIRLLPTLYFENHWIVTRPSRTLESFLFAGLSFNGCVTNSNLISQVNLSPYSNVDFNASKQIYTKFPINLLVEVFQAAHILW